jgi:hypothetical protein
MLGAILLTLATGDALASRETSYVYPPFKHTMGMNRVGALELKLFLGPSAKLVNPQGVTALKLANRDDPKTERDDDELSLFLVNSGRGEILYNPSLTAIKRFGERGEGEGRFRDPRGIAVDREGRVAVADTGNRRVVLLELGAKALKWRGSIDSLPSGLGAFSPTDVAFAEDKLWVTDHAGDRILRFEPESGAFIDEWRIEGPDSLDGPLALAVQGAKDKWNRSRRFTLLVVDERGQRILSLDGKGRRRASARDRDLLPDPARFGYPVLDLHGQILLPDSLGGRIVKLDRALRTLRIIDHIDDDEQPLDHPNSLALNRRFGQLFIVEARGGTYAWTGTAVTGATLVPVSAKEERGIQLEFFLAEPSMISLSLFLPTGERELQAERRRPAGERREWLNLEDFDAAALADATVILRATPTYSARKQVKVERRLRLPASFTTRRSKPEGGGP